MNRNPIPSIAIFDIGKTNKKFFIFDSDYNIIEEISHSFNETEDEDGFPCDDINWLTKWIREILDNKINDPAIAIQAINFAAYGASLVHINKAGHPITPLYNYLKPFPAVLEDEFYNRYGGREQFAIDTASPVLGNLNAGMQLLYLKNKKENIFEKIHTSLHLPQYISYLVHGKSFTDITSIGCHTALWHFKNKNYHHWVINEGIQQKLAPFFSSGNTIDTICGNYSIKAGVGLHDSSAALIPFLLTEKEPFLLLSTGTWCISMNPFNNTPLTADELAQNCVCYLSYKGNSIKASRLFAGQEYEQEINKLADFFSVDSRYFHTIPFQKELLPKESQEQLHLSGFAIPKNATAETAYHHLMLYLVQKQKKSTMLVLKNSPVKKIFVDGGFTKNEVYMNLLASNFPSMKMYAATINQATALGAALAIHHTWNNRPLFQNQYLKLIQY